MRKQNWTEFKAPDSATYYETLMSLGSSWEYGKSLPVELDVPFQFQLWTVRPSFFNFDSPYLGFVRVLGFVFSHFGKE